MYAVALGVVCALSSCSISYMRTQPEQPEQKKFDGLQKVIHDDILVEDEDGNVVNVDQGLAIEPEPCTLTNVSCNPDHHEHIGSGNIAFRDTCGECKPSGECIDGYYRKDDRCWYDPPTVGPPGAFHDLDFTRDLDARCQANAQWMDLDYNYYDTKLNCDELNCQHNIKRFCFRRASKDSCEGTASGYYGNDKNDRVQDCVWVSET